MAAELIAPGHTPSGFETVIKNPDVEMGKTWNLWWNTTLSDDPATWDDEVRAVNEMQDRLGDLSIEQRLVRAHIAELCRLHPLFPGSADILCGEIGRGSLSSQAKLGCEGRGLLDSLGHHSRLSMVRQHHFVLGRYSSALEKWLSGDAAGNATDVKVLRWLGPITVAKGTFTGRIAVVLQGAEPSRSAIKNLCRDQCRRAHGDSVLDTPARPFRCFDCEESDPESGQCPCCWGMFLDAALMCTGSPDSQATEGRNTFIEEYVMAYAMAIGGWLKETPPARITWPIDGEYVTADTFQQIAENVQSLLGSKDAVKEWLASCLLKTLKDNQRWHKKAEAA